MPRSGFTLVELTIVIAILAILAALVLPKLSNASDQAAAAAAQTNLGIIQRQIERYAETHGQFPTTIEADWFAGGNVPTNPFAQGNGNGGNDIWLDPNNDPTLTEPTNNAMDLHSRTGWWYNPANGQVRARVKAMDTPLETLELYNAVNNGQITALGDRRFTPTR